MAPQQTHHLPSFPQAGIWFNLQLELPRLFALLVTGLFTERAFSPSTTTPSTTTALAPFSTSPAHPLSAFRTVAVVLQTLCILSEFVFGSALSSILVLLVPPLAANPSPLALTTLRVFPLAAMITITGCLEFFAKIRRRRRHRRLSSLDSSEDLSQYAGMVANTINMMSHTHPLDVAATTNMASSSSSSHHHHSLHTRKSSASMPSTSYSSDGYTTPPLSPADSYASGSSGALASGLPSPTGHCPSPDRAAAVRHMQAAAQAHPDIYLMQHTLDTNESMYFVHKKLRPIKTRVYDEMEGGEYRSLVEQLQAQNKMMMMMQQQQQKYNKPGSPLQKPAVVATVTVVRGKQPSVGGGGGMSVPVAAGV